MGVQSKIMNIILQPHERIGAFWRFMGLWVLELGGLIFTALVVSVILHAADAPFAALQKVRDAYPPVPRVINVLEERK
jgi:hypothetical protein